MTCIVGVADGSTVWVGGDSCGMDSSYQRAAYRSPKVFRHTGDGVDMLIGYTTSFRWGQVLQHGLTVPRGPHDVDPWEWMISAFVPAVQDALEAAKWSAKADDGSNAATAGQALIGFRGRVFVLHSDYCVLEPAHGYEAIGCGADYALGSLATTGPRTFLVGDDGILSPPPIAGRARVLRALAAATRHSGGVMEPFTVLQSAALAYAAPPSLDPPPPS